MPKIRVEGGHKLTGVINISGAKNSVVALIPAAILCDEETTITNVPDISDVDNLEEILSFLAELDLKIKSKTTKVSKKSKKATAEESNVSKENEVTKQDEIPQKVDNEVGVHAHNDDEIAMIYKGRAVTYKEVREGQIFAKG